jgi:beta-N-acetylhexosaminidase
MKRIFLLLLLPFTLSAKKNDSLDIKIGQMIMIGIGDRIILKDDDVLIQELRSGKIGGVVLFEKNIAKSNSKDSMRRLTAKLHSSSSIPYSFP